MITLNQILESDINQLLSYRGQEFCNTQVKIYHSVLLNYMTGNESELLNLEMELLQAVKTNPDFNIILRLTKMRHRIRTYKISDEDLIEYSYLGGIPSQWLGEYLFVLSNMYSCIHKHKEAMDCYLHAFHELKRSGVRKKAVRSLTNAISAESCLRPEKHYLSDLLFAYREAKSTQDFPSIANTLINLSREYQRLGLYAMSTKYANRGIALYARHNQGGLDHLLALCHRAYLYAQINAFKEARQDIEAALGSNFLEVKSAIDIMIDKYPELSLSNDLSLKLEHSLSVDINKKSITTTWAERKLEPNFPIKTKLESQLINLLIKKPQSKSELTSALYGTKIEASASVNRLNNLLNRIRKNNPGLISFRENRYFLTADIYSPELTNKILGT